jgi:hypothetical protein
MSPAAKSIEVDAFLVALVASALPPRPVLAPPAAPLAAPVAPGGARRVKARA